MKPDRNDGARAAVTAIKDLILSEHLRPGAPMPTEAALVKRLGISRSSVREAIRTLVALDILTVRHGTGTFVGQLSLRPLVEGLVFRGVLQPGDDLSVLREVVEVRRGLDLSLAPRVVERLSGSETDDLRAYVEQMKKLAAGHKTYPVQDRQFHLNLAERLGNSLYGQLVAAFWDIHTTVAPRLGIVAQRDLDITADAHEAMLNAAVEGDLDAYRDAVEAHYAPILRVLDQHPITS